MPISVLQPSKKHLAGWRGNDLAAIACETECVARRLQDYAGRNLYQDCRSVLQECIRIVARKSRMADVRDRALRHDAYQVQAVVLGMVRKVCLYYCLLASMLFLVGQTPGLCKRSRVVGKSWSWLNAARCWPSGRCWSDAACRLKSRNFEGINWCWPS